ncbi:alpha/beta fold hydrolase [Lysobacter sp. A378]
MPKGGHFAAMEQPQLLAEEIRAFFRPLGTPVSRQLKVGSYFVDQRSTGMANCAFLIDGLKVVQKRVSCWSL